MSHSYIKYFTVALLTAAEVCAFGKEMQPPAVESAAFDLDSFRNPSSEYRSVPFWSWNEQMLPSEIKRQVAEMKDAGWGGAFVHSRVGLTTPYMKDEWFKAVDATIEACRENGMYVWLYDEDKFPSGFSGGEVPFADPAFREKMLIAKKVGDKAPENAVAIGSPADGIQVYSYTTPIGNAWFNGACYVDTMSEAAMRKFIDSAYEPYWKRYSDSYGNLILAEFTDEPSMRRGVPPRSAGFSTDVIAAFKEMWGYDPSDQLYKLFLDRDGAKKFRLHYSRTLNALMERNFFKQIGQWCDSRGISLTGHCLWEWPLYRQQCSSGRVMPYYRHMGIPGVDALGMETKFHAGTVKQCASVANQYGKNRIISEIYGVCGQGMSFADRKWLALSQMSYGVNLINPHISLYTMSGCRKRDYPQNIYYPQAWWKLNKYLDEPLARLCYLLSKGKPDVDTLVIHPFESIQSRWAIDIDTGKDVNRNVYMTATKKSYDDVEKIASNFDAVIQSLASSQNTFDFADEQLLEEDGFVKDGKIGIGNMAYKNVVVPSMYTMRPSTFAFLKEFAAAGGTVILAGDPPSELDCEENDEIVEWFKKVHKVSPEELGAALAPEKTVSLKSSTPGADKFMRVFIKEMEDGSKTVFVANLGRVETFKGEVSISGGSFSRAQKYDYNDGKIKDIYSQKTEGGISVPVEIPPADAVALRAASGVSPVNKPAKLYTIASETIGDWSVRRLDDNCLTLDMARYSFDGSEMSKAAVPVIEIQRHLNRLKQDGQLVLSYPFKVEGLSKNRPVKLVVEYPERCQIKVNGEIVEYDPKLGFWLDFRWMPIDITGKLRDGENTVELFYKDFKYGDTAVYEPAWRRYGTEIESVYLVGDFSVKAEYSDMKMPEQPDISACPPYGKPVRNAQYEFVPPNLVLASAPSIALCEPREISTGDVTKQGMPFYTGRICYTAMLKDISVPNGARAELEIEGALDVPVAEVFVNGKRAKVIYEAPLRADITDCLDGKIATIEIVLYTTLRNLMGPHHNTQGEPMWCGPSSFDSACNAKQFEKWSQTGQIQGRWLPDYCLRSIGELGKISLKIRKEI